MLGTMNDEEKSTSFDYYHKFLNIKILKWVLFRFEDVVHSYTVYYSSYGADVDDCWSTKYVISYVNRITNTWLQINNKYFSCKSQVASRDS